MAEDDHVGLLDSHKQPSASVNSTGPVMSPRHSRHLKGNSVEEMMPLDETEEANFSKPRPFVGQNMSFIDTEPQLLDGQGSVIRRLTTKLRSPVTPRFLSVRKSRGKDYANLHDSHDADMVSVDISSLGGLGFQMDESPTDLSHVGPNAEQLTQQDTAYHGPTTPEKPDFNTFRKRRTLGAGMVIGVQLKRDPSSGSDRRAEATSSSEVDVVHRSQTVKVIGKNLAQERNTIVAVSEPVQPIDITSLDGATIKHRTSQTFDAMMRSRTTTALADDPQSYFFPSDPDIPDWKPFSMRGAYILMLMFGAWALAAFQEYLCQWSIRKERVDSGILAFNEVAEISVWNFFAWKYLPTMVTIIYAVLFSIMDFDIRRLEPYYQLSQPQGSRASASLNLDHLTMFQYFVPFNAFRLRQWAVLASTMGNIIAATVAPALQNPTLDFGTNPRCKDGACPDGQTTYRVRVDHTWSRLLSAAYIIVGFMTLILFFHLRRKSGLLSDPRGIAGIASMATKSHILQDFKGLDLATRGEIHKRLAHRRFVLYKSSIWQGEWNPTSEVPQDSERRLRSPHPIMLRKEAGIPFVIVLVLLLAAVPVISLTPARAVPNAAPWLPILIATILKLVWSTFEADVRLIEPFYQLSKGNAKAENSLTLDYQATPYGWMPIRATVNGHYLVALVGLASVCLDVLSVTIGSFSVESQVFLRREAVKDVSNQDETFISFWTSLILSIVVLVFVIFVAVLVYKRRQHAFLPREPSTIAAVLSFIYASNMLNDFIDTETLNHRAMEERLKKTNKRYGLGWFRGRDGKLHCAIDEEPMRSRYVHGKPYSEALAGPSQSHEAFYMV